MPHINPAMRESVGALCAKLPGADEPTYKGTCFFVQVTSTTGQVVDYLVTARHVLDGLRSAGGGAYLRVNRGRVGQFNQGVIDEPIPTEGWLLHDDPHVDLAVLPLGFAEALGDDHPAEVFRFLKLRLDRLSSTRPPEMRWPPLEGEDILFIAMTNQFVGKNANLPTVRRGGIALVTDEPLDGKYGPAQYYVIEGQVYPGNSGSPVWVYYRGGLVMLGVLAFAYPTEEEIKRRPTGTDIYYNFGLSLVVPIEKVDEIVNSETEKKRRESAAQGQQPGLGV